MSFSKCIEILIKYHKSFLLGIRTTLIVALIGTLIGLLIGLLAGGIRAIRPDKTLSKGRKALKVFIDLLIKIYIEVFRGTPMMVQAVFIYYLVYTNIVHWDKMVAAIFVIMQTMMDIVLPQAIRNAFPAIGNELIVNIKDSSVLMIISITELMFQSNSIAGTTYRFTETYFVTAFIYLCLTGISSIILNAIEKKLNHTKTSLPQSDTDVKSISIAKEGL